jgi:hypothetical protein
MSIFPAWVVPGEYNQRGKEDIRMEALKNFLEKLKKIVEEAEAVIKAIEDVPTGAPAEPPAQSVEADPQAPAA